MQQRKTGLLRLVLPGRFGKLITGVLILCLLLPFFYLEGGDHPSDPAPSLFFSLITAYIIPVFSYITERSAEALQRLRPVLDLDDEGFENTLERIYSRSFSMVLLSICIGALFAIVHMSFISGSLAGALARFVPGAPGFASMLGTLLVWTIMTSIMSALIQQARVFAEIGRHRVRISLFNTHSLLPFGWVSISSSLAILGTLAFFPLIGLEVGSNLLEILPGAVATTIPLIVLFVLPVWPVHQRLAALKEEQLVLANKRIEGYLATSRRDHVGVELDPQFTALLAYRREIADTATWPFDLSNVAKLAFYIVIPPITWVAAALMENLVDSVL